MRALQKWAAGFSGRFPTELELAESGPYWNWKIPVDCALVEGRYTSTEIQRECAQLMISACASLISEKPGWANGCRITCLICLPDMFTSEICIYLDEDYFRSKVDPASNEHGCQQLIPGRSLASEWRLALPKDVAEIGILWRYDTSDATEDHYVSEHWMYGEVA